ANNGDFLDRGHLCRRFIFAAGNFFGAFLEEEEANETSAGVSLSQLFHGLEFEIERSLDTAGKAAHSNVERLEWSRIMAARFGNQSAFSAAIDKFRGGAAVGKADKETIFAL